LLFSEKPAGADGRLLTHPRRKNKDALPGGRQGAKRGAANCRGWGARPSCYGEIRVSRKGLSPGRLEAFSDGVIAVIITIMVLELKVPGPDGVAGLLVVLPTVFLYLLTFVQIGIYWVNHHYLIDEVETVSHGILWANLVFLFCLSLFPLATDWIGVKGLSSFTTALYAAVSIFPGLGYMALWFQIRSQSATAAHASWGKQIASVSLYLAAIPVAYYRPAASLALIGIVAILWLRPPKARVPPEGGYCKSPLWTGAEPKESAPPTADKR